MFFASKLIDTLRDEHELMSYSIENIQDKSLDIEETKKSFDELIPILESHNQRKEDVVYRYMLADPSLKDYALAGLEEHHLIDLLVSELKLSTVGSTQKWRTRAEVFASLLKRYIEIEEQEVLPAIKRLLTNETDEYLCKRYVRDNPVARKKIARKNRVSTATLNHRL